MLNYLWAAMILISIVVAAFTGKMPDITNGAIDSAKEAVTVCLTMLGVVSMWTGLMKIAEKADIIAAISRKLTPLMLFLFPDLKGESKALDHISTNFIANFLGLGWAATPAGLLAMEELQKINKDKKKASKSMCMFMIINMSSLQLITINIISYRSMYHSANPSEIIAPGIFATLASTVVAVAITKFFEKTSF